MGVKQQPWAPTVRRGPIAAEMKSPAPNSVDLPPLTGLLFSYEIHSHLFMIINGANRNCNNAHTGI